jgi:hypothetical protein
MHLYLYKPVANNQVLDISSNLVRPGQHHYRVSCCASNKACDHELLTAYSTLSSTQNRRKVA